MNIVKKIAFLSAIPLAGLLSSAGAHAHEIKFGDLVIEHPWSRQPPAGAKTAAGYMTITNNGTQDDRLVKVTAEISGTAQIHEMKMEGDVMKMAEMASGIVIPAGGSVVLKPKSMHIMFIGLKDPVKEGEVFSGTLTFEKAGTVGVEYEVTAASAATH